MEKVGRWWDSSHEIDVAGLSEEDNLLVLGECKFWSGPVGVNILTELEQKAAFVDWHKGKRKTVYIIFSVNGCSEELAAVGKIREDVITQYVSDANTRNDYVSAIDAENWL